MAKILVVEDDKNLREQLKELFVIKGWDTTVASSEEGAMGIIRDYSPFDVAVVDMCLSAQDRKGEGGVRTIERICK
ncbi:TPA: hypothetical protein DCX16_04420, partial [bacterium]|nr:hypothetical protein [bacterium]